MKSAVSLNLNDFTFAELFQAEGLARLDDSFLKYLAACEPTVYQQLLIYRNNQQFNTPENLSEFLIACAKILENFIIELFNIEEAAAICQLKTIEHNPISTFKKYFVLRRAKKELNKKPPSLSFTELHQWILTQIDLSPFKTADLELAISLLGQEYLNDPIANQKQINKLVDWCIHTLLSPEGKSLTAAWTSFQIPERVDYANLVPTIENFQDIYTRRSIAPKNFRARDGFKLTDTRMSPREVANEINYCIYCHDHNGDFCSKGFPVKKGEPEQGFKKNALDLTLTGCPLEEKISEMHLLKKEGLTIASLAMVMLDNPMCPATGHRICNDCMKACVYQKQDPVNIPQIETRILSDVLELPWGVEIYDLLTRWNPLRATQWVMKPYNNLKVMIAGMGPAGFTLAHHLLLEGFAVVGFDGLKIEPLAENLIINPIYQFNDLKESLDERIMAGFGGVAEYGITVRWDKNFLKLIYLSLCRKPYFQVFGSVRFGGTLKVEDAWEMGFDHFVVAVGAGLPKALPIPHSMAPGMRQANDFLMALQLGNAAKSSSLTNLQIRMPAIVIGGGLTGVDTATEVQAYYISLVEKLLLRYEELSKHYLEDDILKKLDVPSQEILTEYLAHGKAIRAERLKAAAEKRNPQFIPLIHAWGGVTIVYRRNMQESPAYINNHEELKKALEEGIFYLESLNPREVELDTYGYVSALNCDKCIRDELGKWVDTTEQIKLAAKTILVATGTQPNTAYEFEHRGTFNKLNLQYLHYEDEAGELKAISKVDHCKNSEFGPFTSYIQNDYRVSLIGDTHPVFHGNVVKAIASGMRTYPKILKLLQHKLGQVGDPLAYQAFANKLRTAFNTEVISIKFIHKDIMELIIKAPIALKHFEPGNFYRLQNFESSAKTINNTLLQMQPLSLQVSHYDKEKGLLHFIIQEKSVSAKLCSLLQANEKVSLMGPAGVRAKIASLPETILIIGDLSSIPFLLTYSQAARSVGHRIIYVAQMYEQNKIIYQKEIEAACDVVIWLIKDKAILKQPRVEDCYFITHEVIAALHDYKNTSIALTEVDRIFLMGDTTLLKNFQAAQKNQLNTIFTKQPKIIGSIYGNMQCMLKGVCAQCLQWQIDPETGQRTKAVFACSWQDQPLEIIDIAHLDARFAQNKLLEQLNYLWVEHLFLTHHLLPTSIEAV